MLYFLRHFGILDSYNIPDEATPAPSSAVFLTTAAIIELMKLIAFHLPVYSYFFNNYHNCHRNKMPGRINCDVIKICEKVDVNKN